MSPASLAARHESKIASGFALEGKLIEKGFALIAGADEAGRGAGAGPLVAAAVLFEPEDLISSEVANRVRDSKRLTAYDRELLYEEITQSALAWSIVAINSSEIDEIGIQRANISAIRRAVATLDGKPDYVLVDGYSVTGLNAPSLSVYKGDQVCRSVSAASILAKVSRDRLMVDADELFPGYGFAKHKGYLTASHREAIGNLGPCDLHRMSFTLS